MNPNDGALPLCTSFTCAATNNATVCSALGDLYYATNGALWNNKAGWSSAAAGIPTDYCTKFFKTLGSSMCTPTGVLSQL